MLDISGEHRTAVGMITALGGGIIRDLVFDYLPPVKGEL